MPPTKSSKRETVDLDDLRETEAQRVYSWRLQMFREQLEEKGLEWEQASAFARALADSEADTHRSADLLNKGCEPRILVEILV